jgi:DNA primase
LQEENTPSFSVRQETNRWWDFSTGKGGNILEFVKCYNKCGTQEAADILRRYLGSAADRPSRRRMAATQVAKRFSHQRKPDIAPHHITMPDDYMDRYEERFDKLSVWNAEGISFPSMDRFQVRYDPFSDRIMYPIRNTDGKIVNVSGRTLDEHWKEKGLRKYTYVTGLGKLDLIYGFYENREAIRSSKEIILFEGAKSVMKADTWGIKNTGAILTSHLNPYQMKILVSLGCRVVFALDKGVDITEDQNIKRLKHFVKVEYLLDVGNVLPDKDSPVDQGCEVFQKLYEGRRTLK